MIDGGHEKEGNGSVTQDIRTHKEKDNNPQRKKYK